MFAQGCPRCSSAYLTTRPGHLVVVDRRKTAEGGRRIGGQTAVAANPERWAPRDGLAYRIRAGARLTAIAKWRLPCS